VVRLNRRILLVAGLALLGGCATVRPPMPASAPYAELEPLFAVSATPQALLVSVASNGCTAKADFTFYVERTAGAASVAFARRRLDTCKSFARGRADLAFAYAELGVEPSAPLFVLNPFEAWTGP
jgi:hypothetical protein